MFVSLTDCSNGARSLTLHQFMKSQHGLAYPFESLFLIVNNESAAKSESLHIMLGSPAVAGIQPFHDDRGVALASRDDIDHPELAAAEPEFDRSHLSQPSGKTTGSASLHWHW